MILAILGFIFRYIFIEIRQNLINVSLTEVRSNIFLLKIANFFVKLTVTRNLPSNTSIIIYTDELDDNQQGLDRNNVKIL